MRRRYSIALLSVAVTLMTTGRAPRWPELRGAATIEMAARQTEGRNAEEAARGERSA